MQKIEQALELLRRHMGDYRLSSKDDSILYEAQQELSEIKELLKSIECTKHAQHMGK